jgi:acetolactate decarboxylase
MSEFIQHTTLSLLRPAWHYLHPETGAVESELYQSSLISALLQGVYDGETNFADLEKHGDFGLGTFNGLDGEMVAFDGAFYQLHSNGIASLVLPEQKTPFAVVTFFKPDRELQIEEPMSKDDLLRLLEDTSEPNLFSAIRVDGHFGNVCTRTVALQTKPYPHLVDATESQAPQDFSEVDGTLAGFRSPAYAQGIDVAGFHLHFLRQDRLSGGHALDFTIAKARVQLATIRSLHIELPTSEAFQNATMNVSNVDKDIKKAEG